ncbi:MAG TPA: Na+/H+ antiporter NhaA [Gammaproteobacteria bacterium]|nr:Na+/H+ antiporter NhaA [Gammaproteobacteria bacterium]
MLVNAIRQFLRLESASGLLLIAAAVLAMVLSNSPLSKLYDALLDTPVEIRIGALHIAKPLLLWINDGLMALFFLLVGLEIKREVLEGELSQPSQIVLPGLAALGGMVVPALIYTGLNQGNGPALQGWAIPTATDIAFALGILGLLGRRVPTSLKLFLMTLAILDDLGAIVIIALFYTSNLSTLSLSVAAGALAVLIIMNRLGVTRIAAYAVVGLVLWVSVLKSGVHATLAGVALAFCIPLRRGQPDGGPPPLRQLEEDLHPLVAYGILPLFAFANAGVSLHGLTLDKLLEPIPLGIAAGLFIGKQIGVFLFTAVAVGLGLARLPSGARWRDLYGVAVLCGIGFTMSLFISSLAFEPGGQAQAAADRLGILTGSLLSAVWGYLVLRWSLGRSSSG